MSKERNNKKFISRSIDLLNVNYLLKDLKAEIRFYIILKYKGITRKDLMKMNWKKYVVISVTSLVTISVQEFVIASYKS